MTKTYCSSDWHLGNECCDFPKILQFLELVQRDGSELILIGDVFDLWLLEFNEIITTEPYKSVYNVLLSVAEKHPIIYIIGNHDVEIASFIKNKNIVIVNSFFRDNILFIHGHQFDLEMQIASPFFRSITKYFPKIYQFFFKTPAQIIDKPEYGDRCIDYHNAIRVEIAKKNYSYLVCGHSHNPLQNGKLIDCGDMVNHSTFVLFEDGKPTLIDL